MLQWRDVEYLESYIDKHKGFIEHDRYYEGYSLEEVIISIKRDAANLLKYINALYMNTLKGWHPDFTDKFYILVKPPYNEEK